MRGYSAIVGVCWQKCRFLPDRAYPRFKEVIGTGGRIEGGAAVETLDAVTTADAGIGADWLGSPSCCGDSDSETSRHGAIRDPLSLHL